MLGYAKYLCKRIAFRKSNFLLLISAVLIITVVFVMNMKSQSMILDTFLQQREENKNLIEIYMEKLADADQDSEESKFYYDNIELATSVLQRCESLITYFETKDWNNFYQNYIAVLNYDLQSMKLSNQDNQSDATIIDAISKQLAYITYLHEHQLPYENYEFPIHGISFMTSISRYLLPIICFLYSVYILSQLYVMDIKSNMDISTLLPMGKKKCFLRRY